MFDFYEKRKIRQFVFSKLVIACIFLLGVFLSFSVYDRYVISREIQVKLDERQAELDRLQARADLLESKVEYLTNDRGLEEELRSRFDVAKEGEQVVILIDSGRETQGSSTESMDESATSSEKKSFWEKLKFW